jgi:ATP-dependent Clp protease ATP-binding subunit ClpX
LEGLVFRRNTMACSFCRRDAAEVGKLVAGPRVFICDACVAVASRLMQQSPETPQQLPDGDAGSVWQRWRRLWRGKRRATTLRSERVQRKLTGSGGTTASARFRPAVSLLTFSICGALATVAAASRFPGVHQETGSHPKSHKLLMENPLVRVFEIRLAPGAFESKHAHGRGLTIALSAYENETRTFPDGQPVKRRAAFGEVRWAEPVVHEARNVGSTEQHVIRIELK